MGTLLSTQPFLIAGIEDDEHAKKSAFGATAMFVFTFIASLGGIWYESNNTAEPVEGESEAEYHLSKDAPASNYGTTA